ncbi:hypothetical protein EC957_002820 [Mortierella hygrophila]|uniref:Membrane anchor Opy2 N-terminal domain-containing protein n=1 Tax=Mortierella hygrophila TaxID=979708 RepID=A0A9P6K7D6_9FUNG|nr:hypothetical protein EC957_002820 [Mortierella hygrophila]
MIAAKALQILFFFLAVLVMLGASVDAAPATTKRCIQCFAPPTCPPCNKDQVCKIIPASCHDCGSGECIPL